MLFRSGGHWQPFQLNLPNVPVTDIKIHHDDLVLATQGRSFWILDDVSPLRQLSSQVASSDAYLYQPATAYRVRWNNYTDTPVPQEEPAGDNPPDGAIIDYYLGANVSGDAKLEILAPGGRVARVYTSRDTSMAPADLGNVPAYWIRPTKVLSAAPGFHRFVWDLHFTPPAGTSGQPGSYPISGTPHDTPREPRGPFAAPGEYMARLTVGGKSYSQTFTVKMDPRIKLPATVIAQNHAASLALYDAIARDSAIVERATTARTRLRDARAKASDASVTSAIDALDASIGAVVGQGGGGGRGGRGGGGGGGATPTFRSINGELMTLFNLIEDADAEPTTQATAAIRAAQRNFAALEARWTKIRTTDLAALNAKLRSAGQPPITIAP